MRERYIRGKAKRERMKALAIGIAQVIEAVDQRMAQIEGGLHWSDREDRDEYRQLLSVVNAACPLLEAALVGIKKHYEETL